MHVMTLGLLLLVTGQAPAQAWVAPRAATVRWMENAGQWAESFAFVTQGRSVAAGVRRDGLVLGVADGEARAEVRLTFEGALATAVAEGVDREPGLHHFFVGNDPSRWIRNVRTFERVRLRGLYDGVDLVVRDQDGRLEYDLHLAPGTDVLGIVVRVEGARDMRLDPDGSLVLETAAGTLVQPSARSWEETGSGELRPVEVRYRLIDETRFGFEAAGWDRALAMVIDPGLHWSTYFGGIGNNGNPEEVSDVVLDANGFVTVTGTVDLSSTFQAYSDGSFQSPVFGSTDVFVARFRRSDGSLVYASRIGGADADRGRAVDVDATGAAIAVGTAGVRSEDFPVTAGALNGTKVPLIPAAYVLRLSPLGDDLEYSTFLQGSRGSDAYDVAVASSRAAIVTGDTSATDFPTTPGAFSQVFGTSTTTGFVTRLDASGSTLEWSTFLPTTAHYGVALDDQENVLVTGRASAPTFPITPGAFQPQLNVLGDGFVARLSKDGSQVLTATPMGGRLKDEGWDVAPTRDGGAVVVGLTMSKDFPTTPGAYQENPRTMAPSGDSDGWVIVLDAAFSKARYSTYLAGTGNDLLHAVAVDASNVVTVVGEGAFPITPGAIKIGQGLDATITRFHPSGRTVFYSGEIGGSSQDNGLGLAQGSDGVVTVVGKATRGFPTTEDALEPGFLGGAADGFVATLDLHLQGSRPVGTSRPSCLGPVGLAVSQQPRAGSSFGVWCTQAPPSTRGYLLVRPASASGEPLEGALSWIKPVQTDADGFMETTLGTLPQARGLSFLARCVFLDSPICPGPGPIATSNGLLVTVQ